ncbi:dihydrodipicolinate synthase family protein [Streptomyces sp. NBC_00564]|uniref:dihydrodipicolinate synthase family protein n=1 Tax=Streptomyces sp. NBC_00564 TaxID=2903663 RepID=UPI00352EED8F|nr:dihydrodipicolinate synthase family protein [Streptomyces sp. NBC_00564]
MHNGRPGVPRPADHRLQRVLAHHGRHRTGDREAPVHRLQNLLGVKETTKDFEHSSRVLHACGRSLLVWSSTELLCLPLLALGGAGFVSAVSNLGPTAVVRMYELWEAGNFDSKPDLR